MAAVSSICPLPAHVLSQIRSSVTITSLNDAVLNLVKNSLDSNASQIVVEIDYGRGSCDVEDDGLGIEPIEFSEEGGLGKMHHTSKFNFQRAEHHGAHGSFIALLSAISLVVITSHHHQHRSHNTISTHRSKVIARQIPSALQHRIMDKDHGTRVKVRDLFGNMPVRVRQRASGPAANEKEWLGLRKNLVGLLLPCSVDVSITVRNLVSNQNMKIRPKPKMNEAPVNRLCRILSQALFISPSVKESWVSTTASTQDLTISGAISTEPCPHKNVQFLSYHIYPMADCNGGNLLYDHINRLFAKSSFGNQGDETIDKRSTDARYKQDGYTNRQLRGSKKGPDKWPMFCLKIESRHVGDLAIREFLDEKMQHLISITELLTAMVVGFLKEHHFRVELGHRSGGHGENRDGQAVRPLHVMAGKKTAPVDLPLTRGRSSPADLCTNIKLPSFSKRLSTSLESPFHTWTRIKRGQARNTGKEMGVALILGADDEVALEESPFPVAKPLPRLAAAKQRMTAGMFTPEKSTGEISMSTASASGHVKTWPAALIRDRTMPLIGLNGKIGREPFNFENKNPSEGRLGSWPSTSTEDAVPSLSTEVRDNSLIAWIDPITRQESSICTRTGLVVARQESREKPQYVSAATAASTSTSQSSSTLRTVGRAGKEPTTWISSLLKSWDNSVFQPAELQIPHVSFDGLDIDSQRTLHGAHHCTNLDIGKAFRSIGGPVGRLSKGALRSAEIISQVDKKFILIKMTTSVTQSRSESAQADLDLLVLVDQHAADERRILEDLLYELCEYNAPVTLEPPLRIEVTGWELELFQKEVKHFQDWGISYNAFDCLSKKAGPWLIVTTLPPVIAERCRLDPTVLTNLLRNEVWNVQLRSKKLPTETTSAELSGTRTSTWLQRVRDCPEGILGILNSRSCRSAIMFNDELSVEQCQSLINRLARCAFPFQCAHGRPSMIPLLDLSTRFSNGGI